MTLDVRHESISSSDMTAPLSQKTLRELLELGAQLTAQMGELEDGVYRERKFLRNPATLSEIEACESRLDVSLPDDYKEFLQLTDGFGEDGPEQDMEGIFFYPGIRVANQIRWVSDEWNQWPVDILDLYNISSPIMRLVPTRQVTTKPDGKMSVATALPLFDRVIELGTRDVISLWLVHPDLVQQAKQIYALCYEKADAQQRTIIDNAKEKCAGSVEGFEQMQWCYIEHWTGSGPQIKARSSLRAILEGHVNFLRDNLQKQGDAS